MNIIQKILVILLVSLVSICGCTQGGGESKKVMNDEFILSHHTTMYMKSTNSQNDDIAAILREFSAFTITNKFASWQDVARKEDIFMARLQTSNISYFYPVIPSKEEIKISDSFLDMVITYDTYYHPEWLYRIGQRIPTISTRFITQINDYEYNKRTNR